MQDKQQHTIQRRDVLLGAAAAGLGLAAPLARAQASAWPTKPVNLVVPFPDGGGTDAFARPLSAQFSKVTGKTLVIDNKGGAGGTVGASYAAKAHPDGYTLFMGAVHHTIAPSMYPKLDYDIEKDFVPLMLLANVPQVIVVNPKNVAETNFKAFMDLVRRNPGKLNYGSAGPGTSHHLAGELFKLQTKTFITHIPYRGAGPALQDLMAGQVDIMFDGLGSSASHINGGRIKALAVGGSQRAPGFPDVPTVREAGGPDYQVATWYGLWAPKGTPQAAVDQMAAEMKKALNSDEMKASWTKLGTATPNLWGPDFGKFVSSEIKRWNDVVKASGAKLD